MSSVSVSHYSPAWPDVFCAIQQELLAAFGPDVVVVEHIGSTAVPGLAAKPVIDVMIGAKSLVDVEQKIEALTGLGYEYRPAYEQQIPERRYFVKAKAGELRVHVHAVATGSRLWHEHLVFRDVLRERRSVRDAYEALKLHLAREHADDKAHYTAAKAPFIRSVLAEHLRDAG